MMKLLAPVDNIRFDIEDALEKQTYLILPLPFNGMDKSASAVCELYAKSLCDKGALCPFRHVKGDKSVICKHWLRGLCKKGDECEFLHEYDMSKMPECYFYSKYSQCGNKECEFLHINSESKIKDCPWYDRGFCRHGPNCKNRHLKKVICQNYLFGFCPEGPNCKFKHPKFELPVADANVMQKKQLFICDYCHEKGHKMSSCFKLNPEHRQNYQAKREFAMSEMNTSFNISESDQKKEDDGGNMKHEDGQANGDDTANDGKSGDDLGASKENVNTTSNTTPSAFPNRPHFGHHFHHNPHHLHFGHHQQHRPNFHHHHHNNFNHNNQNYQPPSEVTCFKCGEKGHYANRCTKSVLSFLRGSSSFDNSQNGINPSDSK